MFRRISYTIALQFTAFVFLFLLVNGLLFLAADFSNARGNMHMRLERSAQLIASRMELQSGNIALFIPPPLRDRVRVSDAGGKILYSGMLFEDIPFRAFEGYTDMYIEGDEYSVLTTKISKDTQIMGYIQVADVERIAWGELPRRALTYLFVSVLISTLTFIAGLFFAKRSLKPAEQMVQRLEQFTQDASHELRTPIAALSSSLDLALKTHKYRSGILSAKQDLQEVAVIVERLLELARLDKFSVEATSVDLSALIEDCVDRYRALAAERHVTIETHVMSPVTVQGDGSLLRQVVGNLLSNAIKFSKPEGGTITVRLAKKHLSIADTGIGIDAASLPHIFNRFYQADTSRAKDGYGLGLALVKRIVELHGWSIAAKSTEEEGTTFTIDFPSRA